MTRCLKATHQHIAQAAEALRAGGLVAFPTETVYGLGADAGSDASVARIFKAKGRPRFNPLIVLVENADYASKLSEVDDLSHCLIESFWPGPLTLVLPRRADAALSLLLSAGHDTIAMRAPAHEVAQDLLHAFGGPLAAPSANRSAKFSPTSAAHVADSLGPEVPLILDGGPCPRGLESTIVRTGGGNVTLLRPGALPRADIEAVLGQRLFQPEESDAPPALGQRGGHYSPRHPVRLNAHHVAADEALLAFGSALEGANVALLNLSPAGDLTEAAAHLFAYLRALDQTPCTRIAVMPIPLHGLGEAINDRLTRAAG